jgi:uncharacterized protein YjbI with pentapeptide repeats
MTSEKTNNPENPASQTVAGTKPSVSKDELERQKLEIELAHYKERLALEDKKLESDVRDWYYRIATAVATAAIGVATFFLGQYFQSRGDESKRELEVLQDQNTKFSQVLNSFGSNDPAQRAAAANALAAYLDVAHAGAKETQIQADASRERETLAVQVLANRLAADPELPNKEEYSRVLSGAALSSFDLILGELVRVNRASALRFARAIGDYAAVRLPEPKSKDVTCEDFPDQVEAQLGDLRETLSRSAMPFESVFVNGAPVTANLRPDAVLQNATIREYYLFQCNYELRSRRESQVLVQPNRAEQAKKTASLLTSTQDTLIAEARNLSVSTLTLLALVRRMNGKLKGKDLAGVVLVNGSLDDLDLSGANLQNSVVAGSAKNFKCEGCDLRYADFRGLILVGGASFSGSHTDQLQLAH